jgi:hypothetical protein
LVGTRSIRVPFFPKSLGRCGKRPYRSWNPCRRCPPSSKSRRRRSGSLRRW